MLKKKKIIIVDGYNVLRNAERYTDLVGTAPNFHDWESDVLNAARESLLNDVAMMVDKNCEAIIVYDGANKPEGVESAPLPSQKLKYLQVIFTNAGESADTRIQNLVFKFREKAFDVEVVSSDLGIQDATMNRGVTRTSSRVFANTAQDNTVEKSGSTMRTKIEDIVEPEIAEKLRELRDSL